MDQTVVIEGNLKLKNTINGGVDLNSEIKGEIEKFTLAYENDHNKLFNRDKENQHPISAITGLREELDSKLVAGEMMILWCGDSEEVMDEES